MDTVTPEQRSRIMSRIRSRDTKPEILVRKMLHANGYRFRVCDRRIEGHPDIVVPRCHALIEVRGCGSSCRRPSAEKHPRNRSRTRASGRRSSAATCAAMPNMNVSGQKKAGISS